MLPLIDKVSSITGFKYGKDEKVDIALRVVSDHVRAIALYCRWPIAIK